MPIWADALLIYLGAINLFAMIPVFVDKRKAQRHQWRVPERVFFLLALAGGSIGTYAAMRLCHHKTKHKRFMLGLPAILIVQLVLIGWIAWKLGAKA